MRKRPVLGCVLIPLLLATGNGLCADKGLALFEGFPHLRNVGEREWADWPEEPDATELDFVFTVDSPGAWHSLKWRQAGVKEPWEISINGREVVRLESDDNDLRTGAALPEGILKPGENTLAIRTRSKSPDDIRVGAIWLGTEEVGTVANGGTVKVSVRDTQGGTPIPSRITVVDAEGSLARIGARSDDRLAVRSGVVYTADGAAEFGPEPGEYTIYAGRGFEYGLARARLQVEPGKTRTVPLEIGREVETGGWVACDTHLHSFTYARHGTATFTERVITLAGEGIELPISTEHNQHIDFAPEIARLGLEKWMTPVLGNEVTTDLGHFNIWPVAPGAEPPATKLRPWSQVFKNIYTTPGVRICILNHPADTHRGFMPFGKEHFAPITGENLDGWTLEANAVEVINSGALNHDPLEVVRCWMGLLNAGRRVTPVGSSDSHSVRFSIAGQGRTYIRGDDRDPAEIDVDAMASQFLEGRVSVSMGLFAELQVNSVGIGSTTVNKAMNRLEIVVRAPSWSGADRVFIFANGEGIAERALPAKPRGEGGGKEWSVEMEIPSVSQDTHLVAVAAGPGIGGAFWPSKRPYQRESPEFSPYVIAVTGAVWIDAEGDGRQTCPGEHGARLVAEAGENQGKLFGALGGYDKATAAHAAMRMRSGGKVIDQHLLGSAARQVREGFEEYAEAVGWGKSSGRKR